MFQTLLCPRQLDFSSPAERPVSMFFNLLFIPAFDDPNIPPFIKLLRQHKNRRTKPSRALTISLVITGESKPVPTTPGCLLFNMLLHRNCGTMEDRWWIEDLLYSLRELTHTAIMLQVIHRRSL